MAQFTNLFLTLILGGLLVFSLFSVGIGIQNDNAANKTLRNNVLINSTFGNLETDFLEMRNKSQTQRALFEEENPTVTFGSLILFSIVSGGKVFSSMIVGVFNSIIKLPSNILGVSPVVSGVISTILIVLVIFGLWVAYKLGG